MKGYAVLTEDAANGQIMQYTVGNIQIAISHFAMTIWFIDSLPGDLAYIRIVGIGISLIPLGPVIQPQADAIIYVTHYALDGIPTCHIPNGKVGADIGRVTEGNITTTGVLIQPHGSTDQRISFRNGRQRKANISSVCAIS